VKKKDRRRERDMTPAKVAMKFERRRHSALADVDPGRIPDADLELWGDHYRSLCGKNDVLIDRGRIVTFIEFVMFQQVKKMAETLFAGRVTA
jgi:hypothetical protein